jgi:phage terminase large subunit GpA-like protein
MRQFAEEEIWLPEGGPEGGKRFRCEYQPYTTLWFDAVQSNQWTTYVATGPSQSGKTMSFFIIPLLYHLFELVENVVCGVPKMDLAGDKWRKDILPIIKLTKYKALLPDSGKGSKGGGDVDAITFKNGVELKFMSAASDDTGVAHYTSRVLVITETDGLCRIRKSSVETDAVGQLLARLKSHKLTQRRVYMECTVTVEEGKTWTEYTNGTYSKIIIPCPACKTKVTPEREDLAAWEDYDNEYDVYYNARWSCPECGTLWSEEERTTANKSCELIHKGQTLDEKGNITGDAPKTFVFGFRWSAVNNLFLGAGDVAIDCYRAQHDPDEENAEKNLCQFVFAQPYKPFGIDTTPLERKDIQKKMRYPRGMVPIDCKCITLAIDVHKRWCYFTVIAWGAGAVGNIIDYGAFDVYSSKRSEEIAILEALRDFRDEIISVGFTQMETGKTIRPSAVWVDGAYQPSSVYKFVQESGNEYLMSIGYSAIQRFGRAKGYKAPENNKSKSILLVGHRYHIARTTRTHRIAVHVDADYWKIQTHKMFQTQAGTKGSLTLFNALERAHLSYAKHILAEKVNEDSRLEQVHKNNHWLDTTALCVAAAYHCGIRVEEVIQNVVQKTARKLNRRLTTPDGRAYLVTERR